MRVRVPWAMLLAAGVSLGRPALVRGQTPEPSPAPETPAPGTEESAPEAPAPDPEIEGAPPSDAPTGAQPPAGPPEERPAAPATQAEGAAEPAPGEAGTAPEPPGPKPPPGGDVAPREPESAAAPASSDAEVSLDVPSPEELETRLAREIPEAYAGVDAWTAPVPVLTLHGYMRMRGELMDTFWLGRPPLAQFLNPPAGSVMFSEGQGPDPFSRFRPLERSVNAEGEVPAELSQRCVDEGTIGAGGGGRFCDVDTLQFANMRLRLSPELSVSEDVRVKMTFDVFDNIVAGTPPGSFYGSRGAGNARPVVENGVFASTDLSDTIRARRAWAEVRNRTLGELRFGRMPMHWGLGMRYNAGNDLDDDFSTDLDRVLAITKLAGLYLSASYDFIAEGVTSPRTTAYVETIPLDRSQLDDVDQFTFTAARRHTPEELASDLERGELILDGGLLFSIRNQDAAYVPQSERVNPETSPPLDVVEATYYTTDLWALLRYRGLRIEAEGAWVTGGMNGFTANQGELDISQVGYALESELRLIDEQLGLYLYHGLASGDDDVEGLSSDADYISQLPFNDGTISTFRFHPTYRIDLILWRNLMRQVTGAWYVRPGIGYDFIRGDFGQRLGARLDVTYSRATAALQTWGNDADLGLEINGSLYWRSEDGAELDDGFHAKLQYGVLFPMRGLGFYHEDTDMDTAQSLRLILGVVF